MNKRKNQKGFTLLETIIAVGIVTVGTLGVFSAVAKYSRQSQQESENLVATYLCQEGIELVKNIRDTNWVTAASWKAGIDGVTPACSSGCEGDYSSTSLTQWSSSGNNLYIQSSTGLYGYTYSSGDTKTPYTRKITINPVGDDELDVIVDVYWESYTTTVKENIFNWR